MAKSSRILANGGFNAGLLNRFFKADKPVYTTQIWIPNIPADLGPAAFGLGKVVQPKMWCVYYKGQVTAPESFTFHFVGAGDDVMLVKFNGKLVLDRCWYIRTNWRAMKNYDYGFSQIPNGFAKGDAIQVEAGKTYPLEVMIGEQPGGFSFATLLQEVDGVTYDKDAKGNPILPVFRMSSAKPASNAPGRTYPPHRDDGPVWKAEPPTLSGNGGQPRPLSACGGAWPVFALTATLAVMNVAAAEDPTPEFYHWATKPPMGWNSWDCFATTVTEAQTKGQADFMADRLKPFGWEYVVVDIQWYEPAAKSFDYRKGAPLVMDGYGRLLPAPNRFPSAADGAGFKPLADYVHGKGLKFGVHLLRGIPREAVARNLPVKGSAAHAGDIADKSSVCEWNTDMYGVDMTKPGAQEYYDSVFEMVAGWGVDFVKVDDLSRPYHGPEIAGIRRAIDRAGRPVVLSLSPGATPLSEGGDVSQHANMWRISDDFWDTWPALLEQFERCKNWVPFVGPGHFPDADMLPLGVVRFEERTRFTPDEQRTMLTLWSMVRSPLIYGGDLTKMDPATLALLTNAEVIAVDQHSTGNRELFRREGLIAWTADVPGSPDKYVAVFNTRDPDPGKAGVPVPVGWGELGLAGRAKVRDLWRGQDMGEYEREFAPGIPGHGAGLYRVSPAADDDLTWTNPLVKQRADPSVYLHTDGYYYFTASVPEYDRIELRRARTLGELGQAETKVVWRKHATGPMGAHVWAPEIHFIDGKWYLYFAAGGAEKIWDIRMYALENVSANPLEGEWTEKGEIRTGRESFALDATTFAHRGTRYDVWAQSNPEIAANTCLYIARMDGPLAIAGEPVMISQPDLPWEQLGFRVNEAPAVLASHGRVFLTYSASGVGEHYCLGMLSADENADLLDPRSWIKAPQPVLRSDAANGQFGPGHNCFTTSRDGKTDILVYHARNYREIIGDPLDDPNRHTRAQVIHWNADGRPDFGVPVADGPYVPRP